MCDEELIEVIPITPGTWDAVDKDEDNDLEETEASLGFEQQADGVWLKDYPSD